jgi:hypothetical protein
VKDPINKPFPHNILRQDNTDSIKDFVKSIKEWSPNAEFKAVKDGEVYKSKGWSNKFEDKEYTEITPYVPTEKMSYMRKRSKTVITTKR